MSGSNGGAKPPQTGLADMGNITFYDKPGILPPFNLSDLADYPGSFSEIVLNVTWAQLQPTEYGPLDMSTITGAINAVDNYNDVHGTDLGIKLRVWGGYTAPEWAKSIDGPPVTVTGRGTIDPYNQAPETIGRFWTADYIDAWTNFQNELAATYDSNPIIRGISNTAGAAATDEPFVALQGGQMDEVQAGGYSDAAEELTLRASVADYSGWAATPLDFSMSLFNLQDGGRPRADADFTLAVLQEAENSSRLVQAGNHALNNPLPAGRVFIYAQIATDAALDPATVPASYQTGSTGELGSYRNWPSTVSNGVATDAGDIELWDTPILGGFTVKSPQWVAGLATTLADGAVPVTGAPDDGEPLGFIAPSVVTGVPGVIPFSGTDAVLVASSTAATSDTVSVTSEEGHTLTAIDNRAVLSNTQLTFSGSLAEVNTILASLADDVASGTDTLLITANDDQGDSATQTVGVVASGDSGAGPGAGPVQAAQAAPAADGTVSSARSYVWSGDGTNDLVTNAANWSRQSGLPGATDTVIFTTNPDPATVAGAGVAGQAIVDGVVALDGGSDFAVGQGGADDMEVADQPATVGTLVVAGVDTSLSVAGNLDVGGTDGSAGGLAALLAALSPGAYSTAGLAIGGTLEVWSQGTVRMSGALGAGGIDIADGAISGDGTLAASSGLPVVNDGTIEAVADQTLGLEQLAVATSVTGTGQIVIDAGAELTLESSIGPGQTVAFGAPTIAQLSNDPASPTTLELQAPYEFAGAITGFSLVDSLVLDGVNAGGVDYSSGVLIVSPIGGGTPLMFALSGDLAGLVPYVTVSGWGSGATTTVTFVAPDSGQLPSILAPATLQAAPGVAVPVPDIVLETPFPASPGSDTTIDVTISAGSGTLAAGTDNGNTIVSQTRPQLLSLVGPLYAVERSLQTLTYTGAAAGTDRIDISVSDYAGTSAPMMIGVINGSAGAVYEWSASADGGFADPTQWTTGGGQAASAPGGADIVSFGAGAYTATGDGAVGEVTVAGTLTLTGEISAQGVAGNDTALSIDQGGALTLSGGAVLAAGGTAAVGVTGEGLLTLMGGALELTGAAANALVIGEDSTGAGAVLDLEQITAAGTIVVGEAGNGTLQLLGVAAAASDGAADIGQAAGASGTAVVNGGEWMTAGSLIVGDAGDGALLIDGAANGITGQATAFDATIGAEPGSGGTVTLAGGDLLVANETASSSTLTVGAGGAGALTVSDAGSVNVGVALATVHQTTNVADTGVLIVGGNGGGPGVVSVGTGASLLVDGNAMVGWSGGRGMVTVGQSAADSGLFAMTGTLAIGASGDVTLGGAGAVLRASAVTVAAGGILAGGGTLSGDGGGNDTVTLASIANDGTIAASSGALLVYGSVTGTGTLTAAAGCSLTLQAAVGSGQALLFGANAVTTLDDAGAFQGTIDGFSVGDSIDLGSMPASGSGTATLEANNLLTIAEGARTYQLQFDPTQDFSGETFQLAADGTWGTSLSLGQTAPSPNLFNQYVAGTDSSGAPGSLAPALPPPPTTAGLAAPHAA